MKRSVSVTWARNHFAQLLRQAEEGRVIEVTRRGVPVALVMPAKRYLRTQGMPPKPTKRRRPLWKAIQEWRKKYDPDSLGIGPEIWDGVRDPSPGRDVPP